MPLISLVLVVAGLVSGVLLLWRLPVIGHAPPAGGRRGSLSVVIPARDEERSLPRLLTSLAGQLEPPDEILVVDDGSTDRTADVARALGATVLVASDPPDGWLGKPWACRVGTAAAESDRLILLDADTWLAPDALTRLVAAHEALAPHGLLSVQPHHEVERPYEHLSALANVVPMMASGVAAIRPPTTSALAFGPCLVTRAADLQAAGGFAAVADEVVEDIALATAYRRTGRRVVCLAGGDAVRFRMYPDGLRSLAEGWTKNLAVGAGRAPALPRLGAVLWVAAGLSLSLDLVLAPSVPVAIASGVYAITLWWMLRRLGTFHPLAAVLFPIPVVAFVLLFLRSAWCRALHRPVWWRDRAIDVRRGAIVSSGIAPHRSRRHAADR